jgi:hypothetical protein
VTGPEPVIPETPGDITAPWLSNALGREVTTVTAKNLGEGVGVMAEVTRLHIAYGDGVDGPATLIAKTQSPADSNRELASTFGFYARELAFYQHVASDLDLRVPTCHFATGAPGGAPFVLLLEDVADARQLDQMAGISLADTEAVIDEIAKLHAHWWDSPELDSLDWLPPMNNDLYKGFGQVLPDLSGLLKQQWGDRLDPAGMPWLDAITGRYTEILDWLVASSPVTFCHYDLRPDNILVEPTGICVLDWQLAVRNRGAFDIAYFLGQNVPTEFRRSHEQTLVRRYHDAISARGVTGYSFDQCFDDYRSSMLMHLVSATQIQMLEGGNDRGQQLLDAMLTQGWQSAVDLNAGDFLDQF